MAALISGNPVVTLQRTWREGSRGAKALSIVGLFALVVGAVAWLEPSWLAERVASAALAFAALVWFYLESLLNIRQRQEIEDRVARAEKALVDNPDKTRPLWDVARSRLELY